MENSGKIAIKNPRRCYLFDKPDSKCDVVIPIDVESREPAPRAAGRYFIVKAIKMYEKWNFSSQHPIYIRGSHIIQLNS